MKLPYSAIHVLPNFMNLKQFKATTNILPFNKVLKKVSKVAFS